MTLVDRIKLEAQRNNLSISALEKKANFGNGTIRRWDNNAPSIDKLAKIAYLLQVSIDYLYTGSVTDNAMVSFDTEKEYKLTTLFHQLPPEEQTELIEIAKLKLHKTQKCD